MNVDMEKTITEHSVTLGVLVNSVSKIEGFMEESVKGQMRQEVLLEKLANFEANTKTSFDRIHTRVDKLEADILLKENIVNATIGKIEPIALRADGIYSVIMFIAKALGGLVITMLFALIVWAIKLSEYNPQG